MTSDEEKEELRRLMSALAEANQKLDVAELQVSANYDSAEEWKRRHGELTLQFGQVIKANDEVRKKLIEQLAVWATAHHLMCVEFGQAVALVESFNTLLRDALSKDAVLFYKPSLVDLAHQANTFLDELPPEMLDSCMKAAQLAGITVG